MMTGEFEYNDTFFKESDGNGNGTALSDSKITESTKNRAIRLLLFLSFLICVPVAFFNLLTGFALERVMVMSYFSKCHLCTNVNMSKRHLCMLFFTGTS